MTRYFVESECEEHGVYPSDVRRHSEHWCGGGSRQEVEPDQIVNDVIRRLYQTFQPPADMSINEKMAWKEGLYFAAESIAEAVDAAIGDRLLVDYPKEAENEQ